MYAQTSVQLLMQLEREGYTAAEQDVIRAAYRLAAELFSGQFLGTGRTQIAHVIGTASVLASVRAPAEVVAAALVHNAYDTGDFGDGRHGASRARRRYVRAALGADVEERVYRFAVVKPEVYARAARFEPDAIGDALDVVDRQALSLVLADTLEHRLNHEDASNHGDIMAARADRLGLPELATAIGRAFDVPVSRTFSLDLALDGWPRRGVMAPRSYRRNMRLVLRQKLLENAARLRSVARRK